MKYQTNNLRKFGIGFLISFSTLTTYGQSGENLIPNGSFEATDGKAKKIGSISSATGWTSPTGVKSDLFVDGKVVEIATPQNMMGKESPKDGSNYAGIVAFSFGNKIPRSYISAKLTTPLKKGMRYCVKFNVSLAEASKYASNQLGMVISKKAFGTEEKSSIIEEVTHILHANNTTKKINKTFGWEQICGTFVADGGEKYITIGNFSPNEKTISETVAKPKDLKVTQMAYAYYYIDDVSLILLENEEFCNCVVPEEKNEYSTTIYQKAIIVNDKMTIAQKIEAQNAYFAFGMSNLSQAGKESLDFIANQMKANPGIKLEIQGHCNAQEDSVGMEKPKFAGMSAQRMNVAVNYLKAKGIPESQIILSDQTSESPNDEIQDTDEEDLKMAKNRRITFKVR